MSKFKVGDKVYCPTVSHRVLMVEDYYGYDDFLIKVDGYPFTSEGKNLEIHKSSLIHHATPENHALLEQLYGDEFEKPPVKPTTNKIIQAMLVRGDKSVPCWVSNIHKHPDYVNKWVFIRRAEDDYYLDEEGVRWGYATPFDHKTEQPIEELPE